MNFEELGLSPEILKAIAKLGFEAPTPVQAQVIPRLLKNKGDLVALAQTGTGKTAAFALPILNMIDHDNRAPQALILCPTRELCVQITRDIEAFAACMPAVSSVAIYGGVSIDTQLRALRKGVQIIVATPGRMLDILRRKKANLSGVERVILDEADEMLNMGFQDDLEEILSDVPDSANTLLFSATMPRQVASIAKKYMDKPEEITIGQRNAGAENVTHECYIVHQRDRYRALKRIADYYPDMYAIVFCRTRADTQNVAEWLVRDGYNVDALHGDLSQIQRDRVMEKFRAKSIQILVATDVAARGLDVNDLTHIINYTLPDDLGSYTHRSGRTGRAGKSGVSVVIINMREKSKIQYIEKRINKTFEHRNVPEGKEICKAQLFSMIERMKSVEVDHKHIDQYLPKILDSLKGMGWEDLIKHFVSLEFNNLLKYYRNEPDLNPQEKPERKKTRKTAESPGKTAPGNVRMFINLGSMDELKTKDLIDLITQEGKNNIPVNRVDIMRKFSFFDIAEKEVAPLTKTLGSVVYNDRDVRVEPVTEEDRGKRVKRAVRRKDERSDYPRRSGSPNRSDRSGRSGGQRKSDGGKTFSAPKSKGRGRRRPSR